MLCYGNIRYHDNTGTRLYTIKQSGYIPPSPQVKQNKNKQTTIAASRFPNMYMFVDFHQQLLCSHTMFIDLHSLWVSSSSPFSLCLSLHTKSYSPSHPNLPRMPLYHHQCPPCPQHTELYNLRFLNSSPYYYQKVNRFSSVKFHFCINRDLKRIIHKNGTPYRTYGPYTSGLEQYQEDQIPKACEKL